jgi:hypothetical protein
METQIQKKKSWKTKEDQNRNVVKYVVVFTRDVYEEVNLRSECGCSYWDGVADLDVT